MADERVTVSTYVPAHQRDEWKEHADDLDMSQSEFVRTMVQAGRRGFVLEDDGGNPEEGDVPGANPRGNELESRVRSLLTEEGALEWNQLVDALNGDLEDRLEEVLAELQAAGRVRHNARRGGYVFRGAEDGE